MGLRVLGLGMGYSGIYRDMVQSLGFRVQGLDRGIYGYVRVYIGVKTSKEGYVGEKIAHKVTRGIQGCIGIYIRIYSDTGSRD